jgi:hypothetical protein
LGISAFTKYFHAKKNKKIISKALTLMLMLSLLYPVTIKPAQAGAMEMNHGDAHAGSQEKMEHPTAPGQFSYQQVVEGVRGEFQVMSLKSMNMKDPAGNTHHIMVKFFRDDTNEQIKDAVGKIKVIAPSDEEQVSSLTNYSGIYAANVTFGQHVKYGVICLFKADGKKGVIKFWYNYAGS